MGTYSVVRLPKNPSLSTFSEIFRKISLGALKLWVRRPVWLTRIDSHSLIGASPDAVNLWIGDSRSVTSIHSGRTQMHTCRLISWPLRPIRKRLLCNPGFKNFYPLTPYGGLVYERCVFSLYNILGISTHQDRSERRYPHATYQRSPKTSQLAIVPSGPEVPLVRWSSVIDPNASGAFPPDAHPITITVSVGESLYLPAGWWHHVRQSGVTVAVNYWYDVEGRGSSWVWLNLMRGLEEPPLANSDMDELAADNSERPEDGSMDLWTTVN